MTTTTVEWFPPDGSGAVTFADPGDFKLLSFDGSFSTRTSALLRRAAGQVGATARDRMVGERSAFLQCLVEGPDVDEFYSGMDDLVGSLAGLPGTTDTPVLGTLRVHRPGRPVVETKAEPTDSPRQAARYSGTAARMDIEWLCPSPLWSQTTDEIAELFPAPESPWTSPWFSPWTSPAAQSQAEINNTGHVPVGIRARFFGPQNTVRLINVKTGEQLQVFGSISSSQVVEVDTAARTVTVDGTSALDRWDFDGTWWRLQPGSQTVVAEANSAQSNARTVVLWRPSVAGI